MFSFSGCSLRSSLMREELCGVMIHMDTPDSFPLTYNVDEVTRLALCATDALPCSHSLTRSSSICLYSVRTHAYIGARSTCSLPAAGTQDKHGYKAVVQVIQKHHASRRASSQKPSHPTQKPLRS